MKNFAFNSKSVLIILAAFATMLQAVPAMCYDEPYSADWSGNGGTSWSSIFNWAGTLPPITNGPMLTFGDFYSRDTDYFDDLNYFELVPVRRRISNNDFFHTLVVDRVIIHENYHISGNPIAFDSVGFGFIANLGGCDNIISDSTFSLDFSMPNQKVFNINSGCGYALAMGGIISGEGGVTKTGNGKLKLNDGPKTFTGDLIINAGTVIVDTMISPGSTVINGGFLRGSGTIYNDITVKDGGTLYPGRGDLTSVIGNVLFEAGSTFKVDIARSGSETDADALILGSVGVTLGDNTNKPSLEPVFLNTPTDNQQFTIIAGANGVAGYFDGLPEGGIGSVGEINYRITYRGGVSGHDVVLTITDGPTGTDTSIWAQEETYTYGADPLIFLQVKAQEGSTRPPGTANYIFNEKSAQECDLTVNGTGDDGLGTSLCYIQLTNPTAGTYSLNAYYSGSSGFGPSDTDTSGSSIFTVNKADLSADFTASATEIPLDESIYFYFESYGAPGGAAMATGSLIVFDNGEQIENCVKGLNEGDASCYTYLTEPGLHTITAEYAGDNIFNPLTKLLADQITVYAPPVISSSSSTTFIAGTEGTFTVTTSSCYPVPSLDVSGTIPDSVSFVDNGDGTATLSGTPDTVGAKGNYTLTITASNGIGPDDVQDFILRVEKPEMRIMGGNLVIADGDTIPSTNNSTDFGSVGVNTGPVSTIFLITNMGNIPLLLTGSPIVELSGPQAEDFSITEVPPASLPANASRRLTIAFKPTALGLRSATVTIANNDADENPYDFVIQGTGITSSPIVGSCSVSSLGKTEAICQAEISQLGFPGPTQHGFVWNMVGSPTIGDAKTENGIVSATGPFSGTLGDLIPKTEYFVRAYVSNDIETVYSNEISLRTQSSFSWSTFYPAIYNGKKD